MRPSGVVVRRPPHHPLARLGPHRPVEPVPAVFGPPSHRPRRRLAPQTPRPALRTGHRQRPHRVHRPARPQPRTRTTSPTTTPKTGGGLTTAARGTQPEPRASRRNTRGRCLPPKNQGLPWHRPDQSDRSVHGAAWTRATGASGAPPGPELPERPGLVGRSWAMAAVGLLVGAGRWPPGACWSEPGDGRQRLPARRVSACVAC